MPLKALTFRLRHFVLQFWYVIGDPMLAPLPARPAWSAAAAAVLARRCRLRAHGVGVHTA